MNNVIVSVIKSYMVVEKLTEKSVIVLFYIYEKGRVNLRQIGLETGISHTTIYNVLWNLSELGLIKEERVKNARLISLTEKGILVIRLLLLLEDVLKIKKKEELKKVKEKLQVLLQSM